MRVVFLLLLVVPAIIAFPREEEEKATSTTPAAGKTVGIPTTSSESIEQTSQEEKESTDGHVKSTTTPGERHRRQVETTSTSTLRPTQYPPGIRPLSNQQSNYDRPSSFNRKRRQVETTSTSTTTTTSKYPPGIHPLPPSQVGSQPGGIQTLPGQSGSQQPGQYTNQQPNPYDSQQTYFDRPSSINRRRRQAETTSTSTTAKYPPGIHPLPAQVGGQASGQSLPGQIGPQSTEYNRPSTFNRRRRQVETTSTSTTPKYSAGIPPLPANTGNQPSGQPGGAHGIQTLPAYIGSQPSGQQEQYDNQQQSDSYRNKRQAETSSTSTTTSPRYPLPVKPLPSREGENPSAQSGGIQTGSGQYNPETSYNPYYSGNREKRQSGTETSSTTSTTPRLPLGVRPLSGRAEGQETYYGQLGARHPTYGDQSSYAIGGSAEKARKRRDIVSTTSAPVTKSSTDELSKGSSTPEEPKEVKREVQDTTTEVPNKRDVSHVITTEKSPSSTVAP